MICLLQVGPLSPSLPPSLSLSPSPSLSLSLLPSPYLSSFSSLSHPSPSPLLPKPGGVRRAPGMLRVAVPGAQSPAPVPRVPAAADGRCSPLSPSPLSPFLKIDN